MALCYTEQERIAALKSYQILDTPEEKKFDDLTKLVAGVCDAAICLINLIDEKRQWFKSHHGIPLKEAPRENSVCQNVLNSKEKLIIKDFLEDSRFNTNPAILESKLRFYAGVPLTDKQGFVLGTFCVLDFKPRDLNEFQIFTLETIAHQIIKSLTLQREINKSKEKDFFINQFTQQIPGLMFQFHFPKDSDPKFIYVNEAINDIYEVSVNEVAKDSTSVLKRIHPEDLEHVLDSFVKAGEQGKLWKCEYRVQLPKKGLRWLQGKARPEILPNGAILWHGFIYDNTSNKEKEQIIELQKVKIMHSSKLAALGEMAGNIAHEVNNPLAIISGRTNIIRRQVTNNQIDAEKVVKDLNLIEETCHRISKIIKGLKTFSRNSGSDPMITTKVSEIIEDTLSLCTEKFNKYGIALKVNSDPNIKINCRPTQISQVIMNLLNNSFDAIKAMPNPSITLNVYKKNDRMLLTVQDSGPGIPREIVDRMMEPFFTTKEAGAGTGLGLSISSGIIMDHSGSLSYDPEQENTTFVIELPAT